MRTKWIRFGKLVGVGILCAVVAFNLDGNACIAFSLAAVISIAAGALQAVC